MKPSDELQELTLSIWDAISGGDVRFFDELFADSDGVLAIGSDPNEWWAGRAAISTAFAAQLGELSGIRFRDSAPQAFSDGDYGWVADRLSLVTPDGRETPFRFTAALRKEGGRWRVVQWHTSIGVANEDAIGRELTT